MKFQSSTSSAVILVFTVTTLTLHDVNTLRLPSPRSENIVSPNEDVPFAEKIKSTEKTVYAEEERSPLLEEREEQVLHKNTKFLAAVIPGTNSTIITGVGCGFKSMRDQQVIQIQSSNYGVADYSHGEACVWRFVGQDCGVSVRCPCFNVPASFKCFGDYLKFTDPGIYDQRFCGDVAPQGIYRSVTGHFRVRFRSDFQGSGQGFLCYVSCTSAGRADPILPYTTCFANPPSPTADICVTDASMLPPGFTGPIIICPTNQTSLKQTKTDATLVNTVGNYLNKFFNS